MSGRTLKEVRSLQEWPLPEITDEWLIAVAQPDEPERVFVLTIGEFRDLLTKIPEKVS